MIGREPKPAAARPGTARLAWVLFFGCGLLFAYTRLTKAEDFPLYFFCDEAVHSVQFRALAENGWHDVERPHELLPAYFLNGSMFNLSLSVYLQGAVSAFFGQSIEVVRATTSIAALLGAVGCALLLRRFFRVADWWLAVGCLAVLPSWFLHSRTGFETGLMASAYPWFLYFYFAYREDHPRWIFAAMAAGALVFYAYAPGQGIMLLTGLGLLVSDGSYHWRQRKWVLAGVGFGLLLAVPFLRFRWQHPSVLEHHLAALRSYWVEDISIWSKLGRFLLTYFKGFSPRFWFTATLEDAPRHAALDYAHIPIGLAPLGLIGLWLCLRQWRSSRHRAVIVAFLASPFAAALVGFGITRALTFIVPFTICVVLGFDWVLGWVRSVMVATTLRWGTFAVLTGFGVVLLYDALYRGVFFERNYGLYSVQWGQQAIYRDLLPRYLKSDPGANLYVASGLFNGSEVFPGFFHWSEADVRRLCLANPESIMDGWYLPTTHDLVVLPASSLASFSSSPAVKTFRVREMVRFPNGAPGFYLGQVELKPQFVQERMNDPQRELPFHWERVADGPLAFSFHYGGSKWRRVAGLFGTQPEPLTSEPGQALNFDLFFDHPTAVGTVEVEAEPSALNRISVWGENDQGSSWEDHSAVGVTTSRVQLTAKSVTHLRIELGTQGTKTVQLRRIRLIPGRP